MASSGRPRCYGPVDNCPAGICWGYFWGYRENQKSAKPLFMRLLSNGMTPPLPPGILYKSKNYIFVSVIVMALYFWLVCTGLGKFDLMWQQRPCLSQKWLPLSPQCAHQPLASILRKSSQSSSSLDVPFASLPTSEVHQRSPSLMRMCVVPDRANDSEHLRLLRFLSRHL